MSGGQRRDGGDNCRARDRCSKRVKPLDGFTTLGDFSVVFCGDRIRLAKTGSSSSVRPLFKKAFQHFRAWNHWIFMTRHRHIFQLWLLQQNQVSQNKIFAKRENTVQDDFSTFLSVKPLEIFTLGHFLALFVGEANLIYGTQRYFPAIFVVTD